MSDLTMADLERFRDKMIELGGQSPVERDEKGRPCWSFLIYETEEEIAETKRRLLADCGEE